MKNKNVFIIAGPNGAGKTIFAKKFLPEYAGCLHFVNADLIAEGLSPFFPRNAAIKAGRIMLEKIHELANRGDDFAFETTLAGKSYIHFFKDLKKKGYYLNLFYLWIPDAELALARIKDRIAEGGHSVPAQDVRRRFIRSIFNFCHIYKPLMDSWLLFNNATEIPELIAKAKDGGITIMDKVLFGNITKTAE